jgi:adenine-specific DNA-methyltransferase
MPVLNWIGKESIINHDKEVPFKLLRKVKSQSVGDSSQNLIIHGDNLEALKALMPHYRGKIKCIYIDPPYNTGNEGWVYNDNVNSPKIQKWLGKAVGGEVEDLCRHDKWLCMMYPRLKLLRELLSDTGAIFISIDDVEQGNLREACDEVFGAENFISNIIWQKNYSPRNDAKFFSASHDFIMVYAKHADDWKRNLLPRGEEQNKRYKNRDNDNRGPWKADNLAVKTYSKEYDYPITTPSGRIVDPPKGSCWRVSKTRFEELVKDKRIWFGEDGRNVPALKRFLAEVQQGIVPITIWERVFFGDNQEAKREILELSDNGQVFSTPKPVRLLKGIINIACEKSDIVLDSFAGSGTTAHAVLDLNKQDGGNRKFILVEMEDYAKTITAERVKRAIQKNKYDDGFEFCELGRPLFDADGQIDEECEFHQLATYIYFTETQTNIDLKEISGNYIGKAPDDSKDFYLIFKEKHKNRLTKSFLGNMRKSNKQRVVYADQCMVSEEELEQNNILFKQIPYEVARY